MTQHAIRALNVSDWEILKQIRLESLKNEPSFFASKYEEELMYDKEKWESHISNPIVDYLVALKDEQPVAMAALIENQEDANEAFISCVYVDKEHRGKGLSTKLYEPLIELAKTKQYQRIVSTIRKGNIPMQSVCMKLEFTARREMDRTWPDGLSVPRVYFILDL